LQLSTADAAKRPPVCPKFLFHATARNSKQSAGRPRHVRDGFEPWRRTFDPWTLDPRRLAVRSGGR